MMDNVPSQTGAGGAGFGFGGGGFQRPIGMGMMRPHHSGGFNLAAGARAGQIRPNPAANPQLPQQDMSASVQGIQTAAQNAGMPPLPNAQPQSHPGVYPSMPPKAAGASFVGRLAARYVDALTKGAAMPGFTPGAPPVQAGGPVPAAIAPTPQPPPPPPPPVAAPPPPVQTNPQAMQTPPRPKSSGDAAREAIVLNMLEQQGNNQNASFDQTAPADTLASDVKMAWDRDAILSLRGILNVTSKSAFMDDTDPGPSYPMRGWQWKAIRRDEGEGLKNWLPRIFKTDETPLTELLASPGKQSLLHGVAGAGLGGALAKLLGGDLGQVGLGAGAGALAGGLYGYGHRRAENDKIIDALRQTPPGATYKDYKDLKRAKEQGVTISSNTKSAGLADLFRGALGGAKNLFGRGATAAGSVFRGTPGFQGVAAGLAHEALPAAEGLNQAASRSGWRLLGAPAAGAAEYGAAAALPQMSPLRQAGSVAGRAYLGGLAGEGMAGDDVSFNPLNWRAGGLAGAALGGALAHPRVQQSGLGAALQRPYQRSLLGAGIGYTGDVLDPESGGKWTRLGALAGAGAGFGENAVGNLRNRAVARNALGSLGETFAANPRTPLNPFQVANATDFGERAVAGSPGMLGHAQNAVQGMDRWGGRAALGLPIAAQGYTMLRDKVHNEAQQGAIEGVHAYARNAGLVNEQGQLDVSGAMQKFGPAGLDHIVGYLDPIFRTFGLDPGQMSTMQKLMIVAGVLTGSGGALFGNPTVAGLGGAAALGGLFGLGGRGPGGGFAGAPLHNLFGSVQAAQ